MWNDCGISNQMELLNTQICHLKSVIAEQQSQIANLYELISSIDPTPSGDFLVKGNLVVKGNVTIGGNTLNNGDLQIGSSTSGSGNRGDLILTGLVLASSGAVLIDPGNLSCAFTSSEFTTVNTSDITSSTAEIIAINGSTVSVVPSQTTTTFTKNAQNMNQDLKFSANQISRINSRSSANIISKTESGASVQKTIEATEGLNKSTTAPSMEKRFNADTMKKTVESTDIDNSTVVTTLKKDTQAGAITKTATVTTLEDTKLAADISTITTTQTLASKVTAGDVDATMTADKVGAKTTALEVTTSTTANSYNKTLTVEREDTFNQQMTIGTGTYKMIKTTINSLGLDQEIYIFVKTGSTTATTVAPVIIPEAQPTVPIPASLSLLKAKVSDDTIGWYVESSYE